MQGYRDKPSLQFGRTNDVDKPYYIMTYNDNSSEIIHLTEAEAMHLINIGWEMTSEEKKCLH